MFESLKRFFAKWHRIPKHKVPRWVRGKLYKHKYVADDNREYKVTVNRYRSTTYRYAMGQGNWFETHDKSKVPPGPYFVKTKKWKKVKYYYRNIAKKEE